MPTNHTISPTKPLSVKSQLNDIGFRIIMIPMFGIAIPLLTGLVNIHNFNNWQIKLSFLYTIFIAFVIWQGNRYLLFTLRSYFNWFEKPVKKMFALLVSIPFYTMPVSILLLIGWYRIFAKGAVNWDIVITTSLVIMICVIFIVHVYETVFLVKESESEILRNSQLERARAESALEALKNQIDPHFIFNSLNTLSHLIEEAPVKAKEFNDNLADVYRYILQKKGSDLVLLREEVNFVNDYFSLLNIRFEKAVRLNINVDPGTLDQYFVPPISLQVLVENAIKHNEFSVSEPMIISISLDRDFLIVQNPVRKKLLSKPSSGLGLNNLKERYRLTTNKEVLIAESNILFIVHLPVLKID
jgi:sensor histidine kinase YesM